MLYEVITAMSPKLAADNGRHTVIRPMVYVEEQDIAEFARRNQRNNFV